MAEDIAPTIHAPIIFLLTYVFILTTRLPDYPQNVVFSDDPSSNLCIDIVLSGYYKHWLITRPLTSRLWKVMLSIEFG